MILYVVLGFLEKTSQEYISNSPDRLKATLVSVTMKPAREVKPLKQARKQSTVKSRTTWAVFHDGVLLFLQESCFNKETLKSKQTDPLVLGFFLQLI